MEIGLYTFADVARDPRTGHTISPERRMADLMEEIVLADDLGPDVFGLGVAKPYCAIQELDFN